MHVDPREPRGERRLRFVPSDENIGFRNYRFSIFSRPDIFNRLALDQTSWSSKARTRVHRHCCRYEDTIRLLAIEAGAKIANPFDVREIPSPTIACCSERRVDFYTG